MKYLILCLSIFVLAACEPDQSADRIQAEKTKIAMAEAERQVGMPSVVNFQERRLAKMIYELRDKEDLATFTYVVSLEGKLVFLGRSIGYGLPYSVQYSNPERVLRSGEYPGAGPGGTIPQAEPNGLFMPDGLTATWIMLIDEATGEVRPVYVEPQILVSPFKLHKD